MQVAGLSLILMKKYLLIYTHTIHTMMNEQFASLTTPTSTEATVSNCQINTCPSWSKWPHISRLGQESS